MTTDGDVHDTTRNNFRQSLSHPPHGLRALVVDDDSIMVQLACRMLEALGFRVEVAQGSSEALSAMKGGRYDLLLTDLNMPHINGLDLAGRFRQRSKKTRIVIMTGCNPAELQEEMQVGTVDCWLFKPLHFSVLKDTVSGLFPAEGDGGSAD